MVFQLQERLSLCRQCKSTFLKHLPLKKLFSLSKVAKYNKLYLCGSKLPANLSLKSKARTMVGFEIQGDFNCGPSSHLDFIKNYFLLKRMFRFFRHSRQMPYFNVSRQKVTHFNALGQKVTDLNEIEERDRGKR